MKISFKASAAERRAAWRTAPEPPELKPMTWWRWLRTTG